MSEAKRPDSGDRPEEVLVVPRASLEDRWGVLPAGYSSGEAGTVLAAVTQEGFFYPRGRAESEARLKQVIPYCALVHRDSIFLFRRRGGGEERLRDRMSIGVGGHVNLLDAPGGGDLRAAVRRGLDRELAEEVRIEGTGRLSALGVMNDDSNSVGRVHIGLVYRLELDSPSVTVREVDSLEGEFVPLSTLPEFYDRLETWSQALVAPLMGAHPPN